MKYKNQKKINIVHVIPTPDGGGAEYLVRRLSSYLYKNGFNISTIYFYNPSKIKLKRYEYCLNLSGPKDIRAIFYLRKKLYEISNENLMLIHAHLASPLYFIPLATFGLKTMNIFTEHNTYNRRRKYRVFNLIEKFIYSKYHKIICISKGTKKNLTQWLGLDMNNKKILVIYNGSRLLRYSKRNKINPKKIKLISIGSLSEQKGFDVAITAISLIKNYIDKYVILGSGAQKRRLIALARDLNITEKISLVGYKKNIQKYLSNADIGLIPSRWEGFGLVSIEMLSSGLPIICSNVIGLREILFNCPVATLVKPEHPNLLAKSIIQKAKNLSESTIKISHIAKKFSEQYDINNFMNNHIKFYLSLDI